MRRAYGETEQFNLKQDFGGLIDIEFLAQFMVLAYANKYPNLAIWPDNVRILRKLKKRVFGPPIAVKS